VRTGSTNESTVTGSSLSGSSVTIGVVMPSILRPGDRRAVGVAAGSGCAIRVSGLPPDPRRR
jgi:hypothetical protein